MKYVSKKIRIGDLVKVIGGSSKGSSGKVKSIKGDRAIVNSVGCVIVHKKQNKNSTINSEYGRVKRESLIHISNLINFSSGSPSRVGFLLIESQDGSLPLVRKTKFRILKNNGNRID